MFDNSGNLLTYERFKSTYSFPVQFGDSVIKAIPVTLLQLVKSYICYNSITVTNPKFILEGVELTEKKKQFLELWNWKILTGEELGKFILNIVLL